MLRIIFKNIFIFILINFLAMNPILAQKLNPSHCLEFMDPFLESLKNKDLDRKLFEMSKGIFYSLLNDKMQFMEEKGVDLSQIKKILNEIKWKKYSNQKVGEYKKQKIYLSRNLKGSIQGFPIIMHEFDHYIEEVLVKSKLKARHSYMESEQNAYMFEMSYYLKLIEKLGLDKIVQIIGQEGQVSIEQQQSIRNALITIIEQKNLQSFDDQLFDVNLLSINLDQANEGTGLFFRSLLLFGTGDRGIVRNFAMDSSKGPKGSLAYKMGAANLKKGAFLITFYFVLFLILHFSEEKSDE